ncbi:MAG: hypothetical protein KAJ33_02465, partial [Thermoplasmata archaeon]|nr:hypothetical protein [Thermoplasmata archaeon]
MKTHTHNHEPRLRDGFVPVANVGANDYPGGLLLEIQQGQFGKALAYNSQHGADCSIVYFDV